MTDQGKTKATATESATGLHRSAKAEETRTESLKGSQLRKGAERVEERSRSSDGKSPGDKQV
ncbi:hypothetical protein [Rhizobium sp. Root149]|uniref:hypothetical protein n=1 Tax=Rhizobium sp. Root149 TaxID=1736473 RepID=UPI0009EB036E|nr:hypothetical protein [Rhizobium sp. Root149]